MNARKKRRSQLYQGFAVYVGLLVPGDALFIGILILRQKLRILMLVYVLVYYRGLNVA